MSSTQVFLPLWSVYAVGLGTPASALAGVLWSQHIVRKAATELEKRSRREEVMRNLRWAAELAVDVDDRKAKLGVAQLTALGESDLLDAGDQLFIDAALESVVQEPIQELNAINSAGAEVLVVQLPRSIEFGSTQGPTDVVP